MSSKTKIIYRNPNAKKGHAGQPPVTRTLDTHSVQRLGRAGHVSGPVRRRALGKRPALLFLLLVVLVLAVIFIAGTSQKAHAQGITQAKPFCQISAPAVPASDVIECISPRVFIPIAFGK